MNVKWTPDKAKIALDHLSDNGNVAAASRAINVRPKTLYAWANLSMREQRDGIENSKFLIPNWLDTPETEGELTFFHVAFDQARKIHALSIEQMSRAILEGVPRVVIENGKVQYERDPVLEAKAIMCDNDLDYLLQTGRLSRADTFKRDPKTGGLVPLIVNDPVPAQFRIAALKTISKEWAEGQQELKTIRQTIEHVQVPPSHRPQNELVRDLEQKLADLRVYGPRKPTPREKLLAITGQSPADDQPDDVPLQKPRIPIEQHPRAYQEPKLNPPKPERQPGSDPVSAADSSGIGYGAPLPGGVKVG